MAAAGSGRRADVRRRPRQGGAQEGERSRILGRRPRGALRRQVRRRAGGHAPEPDAAAAPAAPAAAGAGPAGAPAAEGGAGAGGAAAEAQSAPAAACSAAGERNGGGGAAAGPRVKPALLLGHFCSTVTALAVAPGGRLLASADRDAKVRVSVLPRRPLLVRALWRAPTGAGAAALATRWEN